MSTQVIVVCKYCGEPSTHYVAKKMRYGKDSKRTCHKVCDKIECHIQYPARDMAKLRRFAAGGKDCRDDSKLYNIIRWIPYDERRLQTIAVYMSETDVLYDEACIAYVLCDKYRAHRDTDSAILCKWVRKVVLLYKGLIRSELFNKKLYNDLYDVIIGYLTPTYETPQTPSHTVVNLTDSDYYNNPPHTTSTSPTTHTHTPLLAYSRLPPGSPSPFSWNP
jgi:hypothetical protein